MANAMIEIGKAQAAVVAKHCNVNLPIVDNGSVKIEGVTLKRLPPNFRKHNVAKPRAYRLIAKTIDELSPFLSVIGNVGRKIMIRQMND